MGNRGAAFSNEMSIRVSKDTHDALQEIKRLEELSSMDETILFLINLHHK